MKHLQNIASIISDSIGYIRTNFEFFDIEYFEYFISKFKFEYEAICEFLHEYYESTKRFILFRNNFVISKHSKIRTFARFSFGIKTIPITLISSGMAFEKMHNFLIY